MSRSERDSYRLQLCATREGTSDEKEKKRDGVVRRNGSGSGGRGMNDGGGRREMRREGGEEVQRARVASNGWAGKGVYTGGLGIGAAHRIHEEGNSHAVHLSPHPSPHSTPSLHHFSALSSSQPPSSPSPPPPPSPPSLIVSTARFCGNPSGTFSYRCPATCRIQRFPTNGPIEITRPVVFGLRAYRMVQHPPKAPVEHS